MNNSGAKLWIVITRPVRLPIAMAAADALREQFPGGFHLLREESNWWKRADWQRFASQFADIHAFNRIETCRGLRDLPRLYRESSQRRSAINQLPVNSETDVVLCLGGVTTLANAMVSTFPNAFKILCTSVKSYRDLIAPGNLWHFRFTTSGLLQNWIVEPMAGLERTLHFKPWINPGGDGVRLVRLQKMPDEIYDATIVMSNSGRELPPGAKSDVIAARFPSMADMRAISTLASAREQDRRRRVIFFGTPFLLVQNLSPDVYIKHLNRCLEYIHRNYGERCELIYRPHPAETDEAAGLNLQHFHVENDREAAELYFLRHFDSIEAVFSVSSTVSRTALNNGFNAYSLWRCFPFSETAAKFFEKVMGAVPPEFEIRDLSKPPVPYADRAEQDRDALSFAEALTKTLEKKKQAAVTR